MELPEHVVNLAKLIYAGDYGVENMLIDALLELGLTATAAHFTDELHTSFTTNRRRNGESLRECCIVAKTICRPETRSSSSAWVLWVLCPELMDYLNRKE